LQDGNEAAARSLDEQRDADLRGEAPPYRSGRLGLRLRISASTL